MGVKVKHKVDRTKEYISSAKGLDGAKVNVGVLTGEHQWLAGIHEYGCTITVTPKMRAYLHHIGVHLKPSTKQIVIPERSFLRNGYDQNKDAVLRKADRILPDVLDGSMSEEEYLEIIGTQLRDSIKEYAVDLSDPPKKDWPTRPAGFDNPLVQTGDMIDGIEFEIER